ncbi:GerMN domain-containing protein [Thermodesulfobacteriota bacterium]
MAAKKKSSSGKKAPPRKNSRAQKSGRKRRSFFVPVLLLLMAGCAFICYTQRDRIAPLLEHPFVDSTRERLQGYRDSLTVAPWEAELYFGDEYSDFLIKEKRSISSASAPDKKAAALMQELIKGPAAKGIRTTPEETRLLAAACSPEGVVSVDFSIELTELHPGGSSSELMTVYSIVNTLIQNIDVAKRVRILVNGKQIDTIAGHIDCRQAFADNQKIVR